MRGARGSSTGCCCWATATDVPQLLPAFDVFAMSSRYEGLPCAIVEAQECGIPVVATSVNAVSDVVVPGVTGLLVAPQDPGQLAAAARPRADPSATGGGLGGARPRPAGHPLRREHPGRDPVRGLHPGAGGPPAGADSPARLGSGLVSALEAALALLVPRGTPVVHVHGTRPASGTAIPRPVARRSSSSSSTAGASAPAACGSWRGTRASSSTVSWSCCRT